MRSCQIDMRSVLTMNATPYYGFNNCGLLYATSEQANPTIAVQRTLDLYNLRTRNAPVETAQQQHGNCQQHGNKRERKSQANRSRTLYQKRLLVNARERERMKTLNKGFENLRNALPCYIADGHISKITTLRLAINYIKSLSAVLQDASSQEGQALTEEHVLGEQTPCNNAHNVNHLLNTAAMNLTEAASGLSNANVSELGRTYSPQFAPILGISQKTEQ